MKTKKLLLTVLIFSINAFFIFAADTLQQLTDWQLFVQKSPQQVFELVDTNKSSDFENVSVGYWNHLLEQAGLERPDKKNYGCYRTIITGLDPSKKYEILQKDSPKTSCAVYVNRQLVA